VNPISRRSICSLAAGIAALALFADSALAAFPSDKPIRMVVPYTPGGSIDTVGRLVAEELQKQLGQAVVVDNKPGASGMIGSQDVARAHADGYTLLFNASSQVYMPLVVNRKTYAFEAAPNSPEQFGRIVKEEIRRVGEVVKAANIRIDP
jgi:tripartite-type tricarboxylate transporter receptor subunit TctC